MMKDLPCLTAELPGIGGVLKSEPEDFVVEEVPAYQPCGEGDHLFLWIEKRDVAAEQLERHLAERLKVARRDIGVAGLKDRRAVTRQFVSVPSAATDRLHDVDSDRVRVLQSIRHRNKLRTGHLKGNRFEIIARNACNDALAWATETAEAIRRLGFPNYYGEQRFGNDGETLSLGRDLLSGVRRPGDIPPRRRRFMLRLALSAVQSALFNDVLTSRVLSGQLNVVLPGDVMQVVETGGCFVADDPIREQMRFDDRETVPTGPLFGAKMKQPADEVAEMETVALEAQGLSLNSFAAFHKLARGARRPLLVWPEDLNVTGDPDGLRFRFTLPAGAYATVLMREFMKLPPRPVGTTSGSG